MKGRNRMQSDLSRIDGFRTLFLPKSSKQQKNYKIDFYLKKTHYENVLINIPWSQYASVTENRISTTVLDEIPLWPVAAETALPSLIPFEFAGNIELSKMLFSNWFPKFTIPDSQVLGYVMLVTPLIPPRQRDGPHTRAWDSSSGGGQRYPSTCPAPYRVL